MEFVCDNEPPSELPIPFVNTTKKPSSGQTRARRDVWKNGWTLHQIAWPEVTGLCGFWAGSCDNGNCDRGIVIMAYSDLHGWLTFYKKCGPVPLNNSLDAEMGGCGMLTDHLRQWIDKYGC